MVRSPWTFFSFAPLSRRDQVVPGRAMMARVVMADGFGRGGSHRRGGVRGRLPNTCAPGEDLRLTVRDVSALRVVLEISDQPARIRCPVPIARGRRASSRRGGQHRGSVRDRAGAGSQTLSLHYDAPTLGPVDLRFDLAGSLQVTVSVTAGEPLRSRRRTRSSCAEPSPPASTAPRRCP